MSIFIGVGKVKYKFLENMCKSEIFAEILQTVSQETEIPPEQILSARKDEETVDARYLLVYLLMRSGFNHARIASLIRKGRRTVNNIANHLRDRFSSRKMLGISLENIRKQLGNKYFNWQ